MEILGKLKSVKLLWLLVPLVVVAEVWAQWEVPRWEPSEEEWEKAAAFVKNHKGEKDLVLIAPDWATQGRMYLGNAISMEDFGRFGTDGYARILEVSAGGARVSETEDLDPVETHPFGKLSVNIYDLGEPTRILYDFVAKPFSNKKDKKGGVSRNLLIDHWFNPRLVTKIKLDKNPRSSFWHDVPLNGTLRGYGIIAYREARFGDGTPVKLEVFVDDEKLGEQTIENFGPLEAFEFPVNKEGSGTVEIRVSTPDPAKRRFGVAVRMVATGRAK